MNMTGSKEDDINESEDANSNNGKKIFFHISVFEFVYFLGCQFGILEHCIVKGVCTSKENIRDINLELFCR